MAKGKNRKPFIDKKNATTYNLLYRASEVEVDGEDKGPERELVDASRGVGIGRVDPEATAAAAATRSSRYPPGHPLAFLEEPPPDNISEERRRELLELGFPDDGYDYLKHMRAPGRQGKASMEPQTADDAEEEFSGPSMFVPATSQAEPLEDDWKVFDASRLTIHQAADSEDAAIQASGGVTAFSRERERLRRLDQAEVEAMEQLLDELEEDDEEGDLEDDFLLAATQAASEEEQTEAAAAAELAADAAADVHNASHRRAAGAAEAAWDSEEDDSELSSQSGIVLEEGAGRSQMDAKPGSIASTYWRPERHDRKNLLSVVDERFEHLALEYDESDIGSLDEEDPRANGDAALDDFGSVMDDFLAANDMPNPDDGPAGQRMYGAAYMSSADVARTGSGAEADTAAKANEHAKRLLRESDAQPAVEALERPERVRDRWDCESVLSLRSNLDNHPGSISEPPSQRRARRQVLDSSSGAGDGFIPLGRKTGIPVPSSYSSSRPSSIGRVRGADLPPPVEEDSGSEVEGSMMAGARRKGETAEEKKARKGAIKEARRVARAAKKELKGMYKQEHAQQAKAQGNGPVPSTISLP